MRNFINTYILTKQFGQYVFSGIGMLGIIYIAQDFFIFFFTAFICGYLFQEGSKWMRKILRKLSTRLPKFLQWIPQIIEKEKVLITLFYLFFALILIFAIRDIGPAIISDLINLLQLLSQKVGIDMGIVDIKETLRQWQSISYQISDLINVISPTTDTNMILSQFLRIGSIVFQIIFGYLLSYIWILEKEKIQKYFGQMKKGPFSFFYNHVNIVLRKITQSFGLVFQAQSQIAIVTTTITIASLFIIGLFYGSVSFDKSYIFPYILALGCISFLTSFIPILGVFIGGIPIIFAGVSAYDGWGIVIALIVMILAINAIEGYFLSPRIVGKSLNIPAPIIFLILFVAQNFMGVAGFFLGVPMYLLLMELLSSVAQFIQGQETKKS